MTQGERSHEHEFELELEKYKRAIEKTLPEIPAENGVITLEALWLETAIPEDVIREVLQNGGLELPPYVDKIATRRGEVLYERGPSPNGRPAEA